MSPDEKQIKRLRYFEGLGCTGMLISTAMLIAAPLIVFSTCPPEGCERVVWQFLALHMSGSGAGLIVFELIRRYGSAALKSRDR